VIDRALAFGVLSIVYASSAFAHSQLLRAEPPIGSDIAEPPHELRLQFSEPIEPAFLMVKLSVDGIAVSDLGAPAVSQDHRTVRIAVPSGAAGRYVVEWSVLSRDGHWTKDQYQFTARSR
jgi:copper resistance protein C